MTSGTRKRLPRKSSGNAAARMMATSKRSGMGSGLHLPHRGSGLHLPLSAVEGSQRRPGAGNQEHTDENDQAAGDRGRVHGLPEEDDGGRERDERLEIQER